MDENIIKLSDYHKPPRLKRYAGTAHGVCYTGMSASYQDKQSDVIVVASSFLDLQVQWWFLQKEVLDPEMVVIDQVAVFHFRDMKGKLLFK